MAQSLIDSGDERNLYCVPSPSPSMLSFGRFLRMVSNKLYKSLAPHTLNISNALLQYLLKNLGVLKLLLNLGDNALGELFLLADLDLSLISNPRIENCFSFRSKRRRLLKLVRFGFELSSFLELCEQI
jgi:hypothetical protein